MGFFVERERLAVWGRVALRISQDAFRVAARNEQPQDFKVLFLCHVNLLPADLPALVPALVAGCACEGA